MNFREAPAQRRHTITNLVRRAPFFRDTWNETYGWHVAVYLGVLSLSTLAFAVLGEDVAENEALTRWDTRLNRWLHVHSSPALTRAFELLTTTGGFVFLLLVTLGAAVLLLGRRAFAEALLLALAFAGAELITIETKDAFARARPPLHDPHLTFNTFAFPSGHALVSTAVYGAVAIVVLRRLCGAASRAAVIAGTVLLVALIGFSRIYLGAHYASDVLAGMSLGLAWLTLCVLVLTVRERRRAES
jgi:membrane-associated phospholipid phosphatase